MPLLRDHVGDSYTWLAAYRKHGRLPMQLEAVQCPFLSSISPGEMAFSTSFAKTGASKA